MVEKCSNCKTNRFTSRKLCVFKLLSIQKNVLVKDRPLSIPKTKCFCGSPSICIKTFQYNDTELTAWICVEHNNAIRDNGPKRWICAGKDCKTRPSSDMDYCGPCNTTNIKNQFEIDREIYTSETGFHIRYVHSPDGFSFTSESTQATKKHINSLTNI